jgi:hypothetical protein
MEAMKLLQELFRSRTARAGVAGAAIAMTAAVGYAAIPDASGMIHACYANRDGTVRIIDAPSQTCGRNQTPLSWNQAGPAGPEGSSPVVGFCRDGLAPPWNATYAPTACSVTFTLAEDATVLVDFGAFLNSPDGFGYVAPQIDADPASDGESAAIHMGDAAVAGMVPRALSAGTHTITLNVRKTDSIAGGASLLWMKVSRM